MHGLFPIDTPASSLRPTNPIAIENPPPQLRSRLQLDYRGGADGWFAQRSQKATTVKTGGLQKYLLHQSPIIDISKFQAILI